MADPLYSAEFGAISRSDMTGWVFQVDPPKFAEPVAAALNAELRVAELEDALRRAVVACRTSKGYPTDRSERVAVIAASVGVNTNDH